MTAFSRGVGVFVSINGEDTGLIATVAPLTVLKHFSLEAGVLSNWVFYMLSFICTYLEGLINGLHVFLLFPHSSAGGGEQKLWPFPLRNREEVSRFYAKKPYVSTQIL